MRIYVVESFAAPLFDDTERDDHFPTKAEAIAAAKEWSKAIEKADCVEVQELEIIAGNSRRAVCNLLNGIGYVRSRKTVAKVYGKAWRCEDCGSTNSADETDCPICREYQ